MILEITKNIFETDVIFFVSWKASSDECSDVIPDLFRTGT